MGHGRQDFDVPIASKAELNVYVFDKPQHKQFNDDAEKIVEAIEDGVCTASIVPNY